MPVSRNLKPRTRTRAFLLRSVPYGEKDAIYTLFSDEFGAVSTVARGGRIASKRREAPLEAFHTYEVELQEGRGELFGLVGSKVLVPRLHLLETRGSYEAASSALLWIRAGLAARSPEPELFVALEALLDQLLGPNDHALLRFGFRALSLLGYRLELERCVTCGRPCPEESAAYVDASRGGLVCRSCGGGALVLSSTERAAALSVQRGEPLEIEATTLLSLVARMFETHASTARRTA